MDINILEENRSLYALVRRAIEQYSLISYGKVVRTTLDEAGTLYADIEGTTRIFQQPVRYNNVEVINFGFQGLSINFYVETGDTVLLLASKDPPVSMRGWVQRILGNYTADTIKCIPMLGTGVSKGTLNVRADGSFLFQRSRLYISSESSGNDSIVKRSKDGLIDLSIWHDENGSFKLQALEASEDNPRVYLQVNDGGETDEQDDNLFDLDIKNLDGSDRLSITTDREGKIGTTVKNNDGSVALVNSTIKNDGTGSLSLNDEAITIDWDADGHCTITMQGDLSVKCVNAVVNASESAKIDSPDVTLTGGNVNIAGTVSPTGSGALCGIPACLFTGAPHVGSTSSGA